MRAGAGECSEAKGAAGLLAAAENPEGGSVTTKWGERTSSQKLPSDLHIHTHVHTNHCNEAYWENVRNVYNGAGHDYVW